VALTQRRSPGLLSPPEIPWIAKFLAALLIIDFMRYGVRRLSHSVPWLWRIHVLHHSDHDFDFTNNLRFHPLDAALQFSGSMLVVWILAPPAVAVALTEALAVAVGMFAHANVELPPNFEHWLRWVVITPGVHRIHHSLDEGEQGRNLGVLFIWWNRIFGTFAEAPGRGYAELQFGVREVAAAECIRPRHMILAPFSPYTASHDEQLDAIPDDRRVGRQGQNLD
jgi:sterol desaturase/sphingolipid hydroxylase (fatty acid hydroxylase superfamily)